MAELSQPSLAARWQEIAARPEITTIDSVLADHADGLRRDARGAAADLPRPAGDRP